MTPFNKFFSRKKYHLSKKNSLILNLFRLFKTSFQKDPESYELVKVKIGCWMIQLYFNVGYIMTKRFEL